MSIDTDHSDDESIPEDTVTLLHILQRTKQENQELKKTCENVKNRYVQLQTSKDQLQERYSSLYEERVTVERQYQQLCESWRAELEDKQRQFDQARASMMGPREFDVLKVKLLEEVEGPYRLKCDRLAKEAEMAQQSFVQLRREHEDLQSSHKALALRSQSELDALRADQSAIVTGLKDRLAALTRSAGRVAAAEAQVKALERERGDMVLANASLREEIEDLRKEKGRVMADKDGASLRVERRVKAIQAEELELSGMVESLTRKNRHLAKELAEAHRAQEDTYAQVVSLMSSVATAQSAVDTLKRQHEAERAAAEGQFDAARVRLEDRVGSLLDEIGRKESRAAEMAMSHQLEVSRLSQSYEQAAADVAAEHAEKLRELKEELTQRAARIDSLTQACEDHEHELEEVRRKTRYDGDRDRVETEALTTRLEEARSRLAALDSEHQALRKEHDACRRERTQLDLQLQHQTRRREELEERVSRLEQEVRDSAARREELLQELEVSKRRMEDMRAAHLSHLEASRHAAAEEKAALTKRYQAAVKEQALRAAAEVKKSNRRVKSAVHGVHQLTDELSSYKLRAHELQAAAVHQQGLNYLGEAAFDVMGLLNTAETPSRQYAMTTPTAPRGLGYLGDAFRPGSPAVVDRQVLGTIADLQARQQEYLRAAAAVTASTGPPAQHGAL